MVGWTLGQEPVGEDRDDPGLAMRALARAVDVGVAQTGRIEPVLLIVEKEIALAGELGHAVGRERSNGVAFIGGEDILLAVDGAAGGSEDDLLDRAGAGGFQQIQKSTDVDIRVEARVRHRSPDIHLRRVVDEDLDLAIDDHACRLVGSDIRDHQFSALRGRSPCGRSRGRPESEPGARRAPALRRHDCR